MRREAGEWEEESENKLKQEVGRAENIITNNINFSGAGRKGEQGERSNGTEKYNAREGELKSRGSVFRGKLLNSDLSDIMICRAK